MKYAASLFVIATIFPLCGFAHEDGGIRQIDLSVSTARIEYVELIDKPRPPVIATQQSADAPTGPFLSEWVVKQATTGRAWIASSVNPDLGVQEIVDDKAHPIEHPVLGKILNIAKTDSGWLVQTQSGWFTGQADSP